MDGFSDVVINSSANIGNYNIINTGSIIEHDCVLNNNVHIAPNSTICGGVTIDSDVFIGANTVVKNSTHKKKISIGRGSIIRCGSIILKNVDENCIVYGIH